MEVILITSTILILGIMIIRYIFGRRVSAGVIYALWLVVVVRLIIPVNFGSSGLSILNITHGIVENIENGLDANFKGRVDDGDLEKDSINKDNNIQNETNDKRNVTGFDNVGNNDIDSKGIQNTDFYGKIKDNASQNKELKSNKLQDKEKEEEELKIKEVQNKETQKTKNDNLASQNIIKSLENKYIKLIISIVWFTGTFIMFLIFTISNFKFAKILKRERVLYSVYNLNDVNRISSKMKHRKSRNREISVYIVKSIPVPCLYGFVKPAIYLNEDIFEKECNPEYVILHEIVHYKHRDYIWSVVRAAFLCIYWFDLFVWIGAICSKKDCEYSCDEGVIKILGNSVRAEYGRTLVNLVPNVSEKSGILYMAASFSEHKSNLKERILRIAEMGNRRKIVLTTITAVILVFIVSTSVFSGVKATKNNEGQPSYDVKFQNNEIKNNKIKNNEIENDDIIPVVREYVNDNSIPKPIDLRYDKEVDTYYYYIDEAYAGSVVRSINEMIKKKYKTSDKLYDYYSRYNFGEIKDNKPTVKNFDIHLMDNESLEYYYINALLEEDGRVRVLIGRGLNHSEWEEEEKHNVYENFSSNMKLNETENYIYDNPSYHMTFTEVTEFFTQILALDEDTLSKFKDSFMETAFIKMISSENLNVSVDDSIMAFALENDSNKTKIYETNANEVIGNYGIAFYLQNRYQGKIILSGSITNERITNSISELEEILEKQEQYKKELKEKSTQSDIDFIFGDVKAVCGDMYAKQKESDKKMTKMLVKSLSVKDFKEAGTGDYYIANGISDNVIYKIAQIKSLEITFYHVTDMDLNISSGEQFKYGSAFVIEQNGVYQVFPADWTGGYPSHDVNVCAADFDRDGEVEIAMSMVIDHGSECCVESLSVFDLHNGDNYTMHMLDEIWFVKSVYGDIESYYEDILGYNLNTSKMRYESFLYKDGKEDKIRIGNIIHYDMNKDGTITVNMPAVNSSTGEWRYYKGDVTYFQDGSYIFYNGRVELE